MRTEEKMERQFIKSTDYWSGKVEPAPEWYEKQIKMLKLENQKLRKIIDVLLERELDL